MRIIGFEDTETPAQVICYRFKSGESLHQGWSWIWLGNALIVVPNATMTKRDEKPHLDRAPRAHSPPESHRWFTPLGKLSCRVRQPCGYNSLVRSIRVPGPLGREPPLRPRTPRVPRPPGWSDQQLRRWSALLSSTGGLRWVGSLGASPGSASGRHFPTSFVIADPRRPLQETWTRCSTQPRTAPAGCCWPQHAPERSLQGVCRQCLQGWGRDRSWGPARALQFLPLFKAETEIEF